MLIKIFNVLFPILLVVVFFCGSIVVHELGHYIAARMRGLYVPRFSIGFGPRLFSKKIGETEFCISLLPLGGYVAIPQLADLSEVEGKYELPKDIKPVTCTDKIIVAVMGAVANVIFALVLGVVVWWTGIPTDSSMMSRTIGYIENRLVLDDGSSVVSPAVQAGLVAGDEIIFIDGSSVKDFNDIQQLLALGAHKDEADRAYSVVDFIRNGEKKSVTVYPVLLSDRAGVDKYRRIGIYPKQDLVVHSIYCSEGDIQPNDRLISIDGKRILSIRSLQEYVSGKDRVDVQFMRSNQPIAERLRVMHIVDVKPYLHLAFSDGEVDITPIYAPGTNKSEISEYTESKLSLLSLDSEFLKKYELEDEFELIKVNDVPCTTLMDVRNHTNVGENNRYTFLRSDMPITVEFSVKSATITPAVYRDVLGLNFRNELVVVHKSPFTLIWESIESTFKTLYGLFSHHSDISVRNLMGPAGLVRTLHMCSTTDLRIFLWFVILVNVNLAILNMLPLPILDGGCVVLALLEKLSRNRRKCIDRIFGTLQTFFLFLLLGLLVYVSIFDIKRWRADHVTRTDSEQEFIRQMRLRM